MRRRLTVTVTTLILCAAAVLPSAALSGSSAQAAPSTTLAGTVQVLLNTVPSVVHDALRLGALNPLQRLQIDVPLTLRNQSALDQLVTAEYTPGSPIYHHFTDPQTFASQYAAPTTEVNAVAKTLTSLGLTVSTPSANHLYLKASAPAALLEKVFNTKIANFRLPSGLTFFANTSNITLPQQLLGSVTGIIGLDDAARPVPQLATAATTTTTRAAAATPAVGPIAQNGGASPCAAAIAGVGYTAPQLATAYDFNGLYKKHLLGQGMSAALVEFDDYHASNVAAVKSCYKLHTAVNRRVVDGGTGGPPGPGEAEDMADISVLLEMLPQLKHLYVYVAPITNVGEIDLYNRFATEHVAPVLSSSWGNCEEVNSQADNRLFADITEEAAAQGQQILTAAGDSGAVDCRGYPRPTGGSISVEQEAGVPWVTGVGGTDLGMRTADGLGTTRDEATWNSDGSGGGGVSTLWTMPAWQHALASARTAPGHSGAPCHAPKGQLCREIPDISADADPGMGQQGHKSQFPDDVGSAGYSIYCGTSNCALTSQLIGLPLPISPPGGVAGWEPNGGTSLSTPLTAAAAVLWDQDAKRHHLSGLGLLNPSLYRVAGNPKRYKRDFHDITTDSNDAQYDTADCGPGCNPHHLYKARKGYDMATGLGSYDAAKLGADMVKQAGQITLSPSQVNVYGYTHGVSTTSAVVASTGFRKASYRARSSATWLHVSNGKAPGKLRWSVNPRGLTRGVHHGHIIVTAHGHRSTLAVSYSVSKPARIHVSATSLHFRERAVTDKDKSTAATCNSTLWNDELYDAVNDSTGTKVDASTKRTLRIGNSGPRGSTLHWQAFPVAETNGWLGTSITHGRLATTARSVLVPTAGSDAPGKSSALYLASAANGNVLGGYPAMNQGTYHGAIKIYDLADPHIVKVVHATMTLGNGRHTPRISAHLAATHVSVIRGHSATDTLTLRDASHSCGYAYAVSANQHWAHPSAVDYSGTVAAHGAGSAGGTDTGDGSGTVPIMISAHGLSVGVHHVVLTVQSQNAEPNPTHVTIRVTVKR